MSLLQMGLTYADVLRSSLPRTQNSPRIGMLPVELLLKVLSIVLSPAEDSYYLRLQWLRLVCRKWRQVINDHQAFWTNIRQGGHVFRGFFGWNLSN